MQVALRAWQLDDAAALANLLNNRAVQDCLRDGLPYPYTQRDGLAFIRAMQAADRNQVMAFAVTADHRLVGSLSLTRQQNIQPDGMRLYALLRDPGLSERPAPEKELQR